ncbi:MAG: hypothetical protein LBO67_08035 [Spirochaetaceae bacterium]|jgi:hypothetical protein|nr:hypothetical protein [Spirochaetaceae bacterium]
MRSIHLLILTSVLFVPFVPLVAEEDETIARLFFAEGNGFSLAIGERIFLYTPEKINGGLVLNASDMIQTAADSTVEIQLAPSATVIKLAENTSFIYQSPHTYTLLYGRIRIVTGLQPEPLVIQVHNAYINFPGGDIDIDFLYDPTVVQADPTPLVRLYCFSGYAQLIPAAAGAADDTVPLSVNAGESLSYQIRSTFSYVEQKPVDEHILTYWERNQFKGSTTLRLPRTTLPSFGPPEPETRIEWIPQIEYVPVMPNYDPYLKAARGKNIALIVGILGVAAGITVHFLPFTALDQHVPLDGIPTLSWRDFGSYAALGIGGISLLVSLFINP